MSATLNNALPFQRVEAVINPLSLFGDETTHINPKRLFYTLFQTLPCSISISGLNHEKLQNWILKELSTEIKHKYFCEDNPYYGTGHIEWLFVLRQSVIIHTKLHTVYLLFSNSN